ncbi:STAS domain-containing protein [Rhodococcus sp. NPDC054953]
MRVHVHCLEHPLVESVNGPGRCRIQGPGPTVMALTGDLDAPAIPEFEISVDSAIDEAGRTLIIDLTRVGFVSISGVQALVAAQHHADRGGVALLLATDSWSTHRAMEAGGMAGWFRCFPTVRQAVENRRAELSAHVDLDVVVGLR